MGAEETASLKRLLDFDDKVNFPVFDELLKYRRGRLEKQKTEYKSWLQRFEKYYNGLTHQRRVLLEFLSNEQDHGKLYRDELQSETDRHLKSLTKDMATRAASGEFINIAADVLPYLWGGSADLAGSNNTTIESAKSFLPDTPGRVLHFGVREHGMGAIMNGVMAHGKTRVFGGTFLCFSDYMRGSIRLAAEMSLPAIYIFTHDSIGLGEDGPTHQPIEHINALRLMPKLDVIRPADLNETFYCWEKILDNNSRPSAFLLSRQKLPNLYTYDIDRRDVRKGAYIISRSGNPITYVLVATGSEVSLAIKVSELLKEQDIFGNIISMPCWEWFMECDDAYKQKLLPEEKIKFSLEAGTTRLWKWLLGKNSYSIGIDNYGSSGSEKEVYDHFGLSPEKITKEIINQIR
jgi:transketolase